MLRKSVRKRISENKRSTIYVLQGLNVVKQNNVFLPVSTSNMPLCSVLHQHLIHTRTIIKTKHIYIHRQRIKLNKYVWILYKCIISCTNLNIERPKSAGRCRDSVVVSWEKIHFYQSMALGYVTLVLMCSHALKKVIKIFNLLHCTKKTTKIRIVSCCLIVLGDQLRRIVKICFCY